MGVRSAEFLFWWMLKILGRVFGYLLLASGLLIAVLFAVNVFVLEPSEEIKDLVGEGLGGKFIAVGIPLGVALLGMAMVLISHHYPKRIEGIE